MTDPTLNLHVRRLARDEVTLTRDWAAAEGWNPGLHDAACFFDADPKGFFVGERDGTPIACISCVAYDAAYGFVGHYIVRPEFRGQGHGIQIWRAGLAYLGERNVGLDGVLAQVANYERSGFRAAYRHLRSAGQGGGSTAGTVPIASVAFDEILTFDRRCFPAPRAAFLRGWLTMPESIALGRVREGVLRGYGVARRSVDGFRIGPLFAEELGDAEVLLGALLAETRTTCFLDIPDATANPAATELVNRFGMNEVWQCVRMYTRGQPALDVSRVFGNTSLELG